jgi:ADP-heptose:LPS heptosyltransferase
VLGGPPSGRLPAPATPLLGRDALLADALALLRRHRPTPHVLVIGAPADADDVRQVARAAGAAGGTPALREAFALTARATALLSPDTSLPHAAAALGVPSVVLMRSVNTAYAPYRAPGVVLIRDALSDLPPADVADAVAGVLGRAASGAAASADGAHPHTPA